MQIWAARAVSNMRLESQSRQLWRNQRELSLRPGPNDGNELNYFDETPVCLWLEFSGQDLRLASGSTEANY